MKRRYKILIILLVLAAVAGGGAYWYIFMQPQKNMQKASPAYKLTAKNIFSEFSENETAANTKYLGKVVELTGKVAEVKNENNQTAIVLEDVLFGVSAYLDSTYCATNQEVLQAINEGQTVTIRGQCDGILNDVIISRAVVVQ
ncbi:hypothetical protein [Draconibacterium sediminis]|uniref:OB-fold protein n=1 Tax=Draconibacterium sediminis TaxID=1544798 RepID=UPI0026EB9C62|nr:hypothetical protein [Draconibacterium sediminis]